MATDSVNTVFVDGSIEELALEYAEYVAKLSGEEDTSPFIATVQELVEKEKTEDLLQEVLKSESKLFEAPDKDFEGAFNLVIALFKYASKESYPALLTSTVFAIEQDETPSRVIPKLKVLSNIYNTLDISSPLRYRTFIAIVNVAATHDELDIVTPQLTALDSWIPTWNLSIDQKRDLYKLLSDKLKEGGEPTLAFQYLLKLLKTYGSEAEARPLAVQAIVDAVSIPSHYDYEELTHIEPIQALKGVETPAYNLLQVFLGGDLKEYKAWETASENAAFLKSSELSQESNTRKIRLLTLSSLAASNISKEISYSTIASALDIPVDDVEVWVIDVIRAGLVEGKLSQTKQSLAVHRSTFRSFGIEQWKTLATTLQTWRTSLDGILAVVAKSKANAVKHEPAIQAASVLADGNERRVNGV